MKKRVAMKKKEGENTVNKERWNWKFPEGFPKKNQLLIVLLVGILLVIIAIPTPESGGNVEEERKSGTDDSETTDLDAYREAMERDLANILEQTEGVGEVQVMITFRTSAEKVVEKDLEKSESDRREETVFEDTAEGAHTPYVRKEVRPQVEGVLVSAKGGDDAVVRKEITEAVQALFGIETHKIKIMKQSDSKKEGSF